jgi:arylformamidase
MPVFAAYSQEALDREYDNRGKVPNAGALVERWYAEGEAARRQLSCDLDIPYGDHERHRLDVFPAGRPGGPILAFIHGGYWHSRDKAMGHFLAPPFVAAGITVVSIGYRLCPEVSIGGVIDDVTAAVRWIADHAADLGAAPGELYVAGHSAGGHLTAMLLGPDGPGPDVIKGGCSVSGLHDLEPIRLCFLNEHLRIPAERVADWSPIAIARARAAGKRLSPLIVTVGGNEGPEYLRQRDELADALRAGRAPVEVVDVPGGDHFTALEALADVHHPLNQAMLRLILAPSF